MFIKRFPEINSSRYCQTNIVIFYEVQHFLAKNRLGKIINRLAVKMSKILLGDKRQINS